MLGAATESLRHEYKYVMSYPAYLALRHSLVCLLNPDEFARPDGTYSVSSLYFDDAFDTGVWDKLAGVSPRHRYRARFYDSRSPAAFIERKSKYGDLTAKVREPLPNELFATYIGGKAQSAFATGTPLSREIYALMRANAFIPRMFVDFTREAFVHSSDTLRVTFDQNISYCAFTGNPSSADSAKIPLCPGQVIMEIKFIDAAPSYILKLISNADSSRAAISKYALCRIHEGHIIT